MVKSLHNTKMKEEELNILQKDYPELKEIMEDTFLNRVKKTVNKIIKN